MTRVVTSLPYLSYRRNVDDGTGSIGEHAGGAVGNSGAKGATERFSTASTIVRVMAPLHSGSVGNSIERAGSPVDEVLIEMEARTDREGFPTVGPEVGRTLALCTRLTSARSVLKLGSGFGYSAY